MRDPGGYIAFNDDDDNENGVPDYNDPGDASEDDLVAITIGGSPADLGGFLELRAHTPIKVWNNPHKGAGNLLIPNGENLYRRWPVASPPGTMWVEGKETASFLSGEAGLRLWWYTPYIDWPSYPGAGYNPDLVSVTIVQVDMDMDGVSDNEEETVGGFVAVGGLKKLVLKRAQRGIVNIDIKAGNYEAAEAGIKTILAKYANHDDLAQAFCWLGNDYLDARQNDKAAECYQYVIDNRPDSNDAVANFTKSIAVWRRVIEELPVRLPDTAHGWYFSGYAYERMRDYGKAIEYCQKVINTWPDYQFAWSAQYMIADCARKLERNGEMPKHNYRAV